jgi:CheY-like chemotaxis protein
MAPAWAAPASSCACRNEPVRKKRFLVIDDQPQARDALRTIAQTIGAFAVEFATNYQDAIYRIRNNVPDIILCDYVLGEGRSGQQCWRNCAASTCSPTKPSS